MNFTPDRYGPGAMYAYHLMAKNAKTMDQVYAVIYLTKLFAKKFKCKKCRDSFKKIVSKIEIKDYATPKKIFEYTVIVHNVINLKLGKRQYSLDEAYDIYS